MDNICNGFCFECEDCRLTEKDLEFQGKPASRKLYRRKKTAKIKKKIKNRLAYSGEKTDAKFVSQDRYESYRGKTTDKQLANKKLRHSKNIPLIGNGYRKNYDIQWDD